MPPRDVRDRDRSPAGSGRPAPAPEIKICGINACKAVAQRRMADIRRVYVKDAVVPQVSELLRECASRRIAYHIVDDEELVRITKSTHHEGVCLLARTRVTPTLRDLLAVPGPRCLVYLDNVQNPHNIGAIVRVCAHFGVPGVVVGGAEVGVSTAMLRTAEGGGEWVDVVPVPGGLGPLQAARAAGYTLVATAAQAEDDLHARPLPPRLMILLGSETDGLAPAVQQLADVRVRIPGTGVLNSVNVACACSVVLSEVWRAAHRR